MLLAGGDEDCAPPGDGFTGGRPDAVVFFLPNRPSPTIKVKKTSSSSTATPPAVNNHDVSGVGDDELEPLLLADVGTGVACEGDTCSFFACVCAVFKYGTTALKLG
jgi:hypothetical protein